jgi:hypothetical protein
MGPSSSGPIIVVVSATEQRDCPDRFARTPQLMWAVKVLDPGNHTRPASGQQHPKRVVRPRLSYVDYFHMIGGRIERPPTHSEYQTLRRHSDKCFWSELSQSGWYHVNNPDACYLNITTPDLAAAKLMRKLGFVPNFCEIARDFDDPNFTLDRILRWHLIHTYQRVVYRYTDRGTHYTGPRRARRKFVNYRRAQQVMHLECRLRGQALRRAGIIAVLDLLAFDFDAFWNRQLVFRGLSATYSDRYLGGREQVVELWASTRTVQGMMAASRKVVSGWQRDQAFPRKRLVATSRGWELVRLHTLGPMNHKNVSGYDSGETSSQTQNLACPPSLPTS